MAHPDGHVDDTGEGAIADASGNPALALPDGDPQPGLYRHYKGGQYRVLGLVRHSETLEIMVLYQALYGAQGLWVRPRAMFLETVAHDGQTIPRFAHVAEASAAAMDNPVAGTVAKDLARPVNP